MARQGSASFLLKWTNKSQFGRTKNRIRQYNRRIVRDLAGYVRTAMKKVLSRGRGGRVSPPGEAPTKRLGHLQRRVSVGMHRTQPIAYIGPLLRRRKDGVKVPRLLEYGGRIRVRNKTFRKNRQVTQFQTLRYRPRPFRMRSLRKGVGEWNIKRWQGRL